MTKVNKILLIIVVILLAIVVAVVVTRIWPTNPSWSVVYLKTGDLYFGRLVYFPYFGLKQVYFVQVNRDNPQAPISIQKFSNVFWEPKDYLKINREEVVWITKLRDDSQLARTFKNNPDLIPAGPPQAVPSVNPPPQGEPRR